MSVVCLFCMCIRMLVQSISVFLLAAFLWALLPEIKWMIKWMQGHAGSKTLHQQN